MLTKTVSPRYRFHVYILQAW